MVCCRLSSSPYHVTCAAILCHAVTYGACHSGRASVLCSVLYHPTLSRPIPASLLSLGALAHPVIPHPMISRHHPALVTYLRALATGPLLARTAHAMALAGTDTERATLWAALVADTSKVDAWHAVNLWISKPYSLRGY